MTYDERSTENASQSNRRFDQKERLYLALVGVLWLAHVLLNLFWRYRNVTVLGWDRPAHLVRSLEYFRLLQPFSAEGLFNALTWDPFYPPLFHLSAAGFYALFGVSDDVAATTNSVYLAVLLFAVYGIGKQMYNRQTGLLAATLVSLFPIVFALSRFTYVDFAMMSLVALNVFFLLKSDHLRHRRWSYAWGVSLGLGLLSKWVFIVFVGPPFLYILLTSDVIRSLKGVLRPRNLHWRNLVWAVVIGAGGAGLWYLLSGHWEQKELFGLTLALWYLVFLSVLIYIVRLPSGPLNNLVGAGAIASCMAAIWYIPNSEFMTKALYKAYYVGSDAQPAFQAGGSLPIWVLLKGIVNEHLSAPIFLGAAALILIWLLQRRRNWWPIPPNVWILGLWFAVPFAFFASFTNDTSWNMRLTISVTIPAALILARACLRLQPPSLRRAVVAAMLAVAVVQCVTLSVDALSKLPARTSVQLPGWGRLSWFAQGEFIQWPRSELTDARYWVLPAIFDKIIADSHPSAAQPSPVGLLVNQPYLNGYQATFLSENEYPGIKIADLFRNRKGIPVYPQLFGMDYVVVSDSEAEYGEISDQSIRVATAIISNQPSSFSEAFREMAKFRTPNGDVIHLYKNLSHQPPKFVSPEVMPGATENVVNLNFGDKLLLMNCKVEQEKLSKSRTLPVNLYWLGLQGMDEDYMITLKLINDMEQVWGQQQSHPAWNSFLTTKWAPGEVVWDPRELPVLPGTPPGRYSIEVNVRGVHKDKDLLPLDGKKALLGPVDVPLRTDTTVQDLDLQHPVGKDLGGKVRLLGYNIEGGFRPGDNIHLTLFWQALQPIDASYTVFSHLTGPDGKTWGQKDNPPAAGFYPTSAWSAGEIVRDQYDIRISPEAPPGTYTLEAGMYLPATGARLPVAMPGNGPEDDKVKLETIQIDR